MAYEALHRKALEEWSASPALRCAYPAFVHYWRERYQRVYAFGGRVWPPRKAAARSLPASGA